MPGVYEIHVKDQFTATHALKGYDGNWAGRHGHTWEVEATICCTRLNRLGIGIDFKDVKEVIQDVLGRLGDTNLNEVAEFGSINPTSENLAKLLYTELATRLNTAHVNVKKMTVFESPGCGASYSELD